MTEMKGNFPAMHTFKPDGLKCSLCNDPDSVENQSHPYNCSFYLSHPLVGPDIIKSKYEDIYGSLDEQILSAKLWTNILKIRKQHLD